MNDTATMAFIVAGVFLAAMVGFSIITIALSVFVWKVTAKAKGLDLSDRMVEANQIVFEQMRSSTTALLELVKAHRVENSNDIMLAAWMAKQLIAAHDAGSKGKPFEPSSLKNPPAEIMPEMASEFAHYGGNGLQESEYEGSDRIQ